jgi:hypothetical protein
MVAARIQSTIMMTSSSAHRNAIIERGACFLVMAGACMHIFHRHAKALHVVVHIGWCMTFTGLGETWAPFFSLWVDNSNIFK